MLVKAAYVRRDAILREGAEYVVYAEATTADGVLYFLSDTGALVYPIAYPSELFEVVDPRVSRLWELGTTRSIPEWVHDDDFYEKLVEGEDGGRAREIFAAAREVMEVEFLVPSRVQAVGERIGDGWVECRGCDYLWQEASSVLDEMCTCRNCRWLLELRDR